MNQIELHPYVADFLFANGDTHESADIHTYRSCPQQDVVDLCRSKGIVVTAYSPLGSDNSPLLKNEVVNKIANAHGVAPANVLISLHANTPGVTGPCFMGRLYFQVGN